MWCHVSWCSQRKTTATCDGVNCEKKAKGWQKHGLDKNMEQDWIYKAWCSNDCEKESKAQAVSSVKEDTSLSPISYLSSQTWYEDRLISWVVGTLPSRQAAAQASGPAAASHQSPSSSSASSSSSPAARKGPPCLPKDEAVATTMVVDKPPSR